MELREKYAKALAAYYEADIEYLLCLRKAGALSVLDKQEIEKMLIKR